MVLIQFGSLLSPIVPPPSCLGKFTKFLRVFLPYEVHFFLLFIRELERRGHLRSAKGEGRADSLQINLLGPPELFLRKDRSDNLSMTFTQIKASLEHLPIEFPVCPSCTGRRPALRYQLLDLLHLTFR